MNQRKPQNRKFKQLGSFLKKPISEASSGRGFAQSRILTHWPDIAGGSLSKICRPVKISYAKTGLGATLVVLTNGANAPLIQMQIPELLKRINAVYGYRAIQNIRITQSSGYALAEETPEFQHKTPTKPLSKESEVKLEKLVKDVGDDNLRMALTRLGTSLNRRLKP